MYFEIKNTPEPLKRLRKERSPEKPVEEVPRLVLAPFSRPPQVVFENVAIGSTVHRQLQIFNPSKNLQQITLGRVPPGLQIQFPREWLELEPQMCYSLILQWTPPQAIALRDTLRFLNDSRRPFDVIIVLKTLPVQKKGKAKNTKVSPRKITKKPGLRKSPVTNKIMSSTFQKNFDILQTSVKYKTVKTSHTPSVYTDYCVEPSDDGNPFDTEFVFFDTSEMFSNVKSAKLQTTYNKENITYENNDTRNVLKPSTNNCDIFNNITYTPLKCATVRNANFKCMSKLLTTKNDEYWDKENIANTNMASEVPDNIKWPSLENCSPQIFKYVDKPYQNKKIPQTSSPKEWDTMNFTMNTEYSHISNDSSLPHRFSTEKKNCTKILYRDQDFLFDGNNQNPIFGYQTFTKSDSPNNAYLAMDYHTANQPPEPRHPRSKQSLLQNPNFQLDRFQTNIDKALENLWSTNMSPQRPVSPQHLQAIAEESSQEFNRTDQPMTTYTVNRTFDSNEDRSFLSKTKILKDSWSKKSVKCQPELWKIPIVPQKKRETFNIKRDSSTILNLTDNHKSMMSVSIPVGDVYSQSLTVDPFLSTTYFYDERAVRKFETEFKRWLNYILTPPAELDTNIEHKIDFGKAWIENRNKEIPVAPTKEQVCSKYHNSHRLDALRKSARILFRSSEIKDVIDKINKQIDKKLITIRNDKNLHLDIGLQKIIMELLLCYNPLWIRIGLETIYGLVIPLKSNSDIEGLSTFIIQRMFKNPYLKNKNGKGNMPNMLLPAYIESIKKYTLKKFFCLVFFLDRAKQNKVIAHDPCLFCRNAAIKESREILIRFTRELIAGIGDITKQLRTLGYVVSQKQSYLDEYKYAVHNIATDIRDGVRLTKVMEIILVKNGLLTQLRTPAISRLQKIHNVQVALNSLKETDFVLSGDITPHDIADGHREKTLSLLWQIIHVFRAPLFQMAAHVIQTWWRKKYEAIVAQRKIEEAILQRRHDSASTLQRWWRRIQYNRMVEIETRQYTASCIIIQKYYRMWTCRRRLLELKRGVLKIETWWRNLLLMRAAKRSLAVLQSERRQLTNYSATVIQSNVKRWLCVRRYKLITQKAVIIQTVVRGFLVRKKYIQLKRSVIVIQRKYKSYMCMKNDMEHYNKMRNSVICLQSFYRMLIARKQYKELKNAVKIIEKRYKSLIVARNIRMEFITLKTTVTMLQSRWRSKKIRFEYLRKRETIIRIQSYFRMFIARKQFKNLKAAVKVIDEHYKAMILMRKARHEFKILKKTVTVVQSQYRSNKIRLEYLKKRENIIRIQSYFRMWSARRQFNNLKAAVKIVDERYKAMILMRKARHEFEILKKAATIVQSRYRSNKIRLEYVKKRENIIRIQSYFRMWSARRQFNNLKAAVRIVGERYQAMIVMKKARHEFVILKKTAIVVQSLFRSKKARLEYFKCRNDIIRIQSYFRMLIAQKRYKSLKNAVNNIEKHYKALILMRQSRNEFVTLKKSVTTIQTLYRTKRARTEYLRDRNIIIRLQNRVKANIAMKNTRAEYQKVKHATCVIQKHMRSYLAMKIARQQYLRTREAAIVIQKCYRNIVEERNKKRISAAIVIQSCYRMCIRRRQFLGLKKSVSTVETRWKEILLMRSAKSTLATLKQERRRLEIHSATLLQSHVKKWLCVRQYKIVIRNIVTVQSIVRSFIVRKRYMQIRKSVVVIQQKYRAHILMKKELNNYRTVRENVILIQSYFRMLFVQKKYQKLKNAVSVIENRYKGLINTRKAHYEFKTLKKTAVLLQSRYRSKKARLAYLRQRQSIICIQSYFRMFKVRKEYNNIKKSVTTIEKRYKSLLVTRKTRNEFLELKKSVTIIQSLFRSNKARLEYLRQRDIIIRFQTRVKANIAMKEGRNEYLQLKHATCVIQTRLRAHILMKTVRQKYIKSRAAVIVIQKHVRCYLYVRRRYLRLRSAVLTIQYKIRWMKLREQMRLKIQDRKERASIVIQKYVRRYLAKSYYENYRKSLVFVQRLWKSRSVTRHVRSEYLEKRQLAIRLQASGRGFLARRDFQRKRQELRRLREEQIRTRAATKIQAYYRGYLIRKYVVTDSRVVQLRRRWRQGALLSTQQTLGERNREALEAISNFYEIQSVIRAFNALEYLTEVYPMMYCENAGDVVEDTYICIQSTNRSISSVELLSSAAATLTNLTRYPATAASVYKRERIETTLKFMTRFCSRETRLFCILCTYLWLFNKYDTIRQDLTEFLRLPEQHKIMELIKRETERVARMHDNYTKNKYTVQTRSRTSLADCSMKANTSVLPSLAPDYGILNPNKPRYFQDPLKAINCLFKTYNL